MRKYLVVIEKADTNYAGYLPDVPGCVTTGPTPEETLRNMREALELHFADLPEEQLPERRAVLAPFEPGAPGPRPGATP